MKLYHRTRHSSEILENGFRDMQGKIPTQTNVQGVLVTDQPLKVLADASNLKLLVLDVPEDLITPYELRTDEPHREFIVPAGVLNTFGPPQVISE